MYNFLQRLSGVTSFAMSTLMALVVLISITTPLIPSAPTHEVTLHNVQTTTGRLVDPFDRTSRSAEYARLTFDVDADLTSMFNWNTKLLFAYITADYNAPGFETNRVVIWDRIIRNKRQAKLRLRKHHNKYSLRNYALTFEGVEGANLTLHINPVPYLGLMYDKPVLSLPFAIPRAPEPVNKPGQKIKGKAQAKSRR
ncbi:Signal peptidase complex subunit [Coemansia sp. RSA 2711]|nr:Signal peptidase complex subunit [Coemansia sp. RSA 2711]KAJ1841849.1 Signal peptidase complex subunit [Coemansia sp. RSA 2708]KAJ2311533.1 Signal peptidase complex subunit [Coemansia sp. RSA 2705]KAJ2315887.1 Signal peptidase complex subunit [Coemansia sp. RSA 2704]KAJ2364121.1 Signal peptidase complex subunit [Coemansia sp. RSA 2610]KAJ2377275.1 Signal peptidase complex subunit [Coemansia sp. RSA 2611]KAJ2727744.1 Signal peptidase complex subunit [Coemansia sp. Cherry 401B]